MTSHPPGYAEAAADRAGLAMPFMDRREFTMLVALVARRAASWSHDLMFTRNDLDELATDDVRQRFVADIRYATDRIAPARQDAQAPIPAVPVRVDASKEWWLKRAREEVGDPTTGSPKDATATWMIAFADMSVKRDDIQKALDRERELSDKYKWQVRDTCVRAEKAEAALTEARAEVARLLGELHDMTKRALAAERDCPTRHTAGFREGVEAAAHLADKEDARILASQILALAPPAPAAAREAPWHPTHRHYKGGLYRVIVQARHHETQLPLTVYENEARDVWVRPTAEFNDQILVCDDNYQKERPRFARLSGSRVEGQS